MHMHLSLWFILVLIYSNYIIWELFFEDVFFVPFIIPVSTCVKILSVVAFQFDCCIDIKKNIRQLITFTGPGFISLLHLVPLLVTRIFLFNLVSYFFCSSNKYFLIWFDLIEVKEKDFVIKIPFWFSGSVFFLVMFSSKAERTVWYDFSLFLPWISLESHFTVSH